MLDEVDSLFNRLRPAVLDFYRRWDGEAGDTPSDIQNSPSQPPSLPIAAANPSPHR